MTDRQTDMYTFAFWYICIYKQIKQHDKCEIKEHEP